VFGGIGWVFLLTMLGYLLGGQPLVRAHFEKVILGIVFVSVLPILFEILKSRRRRWAGHLSEPRAPASRS
jgi:membrane-associated protein